MHVKLLLRQLVNISALVSTFQLILIFTSFSVCLNPVCIPHTLYKLSCIHSAPTSDRFPCNGLVLLKPDACSFLCSILSRSGASQESPPLFFYSHFSEIVCVSLMISCCLLNYARSEVAASLPTGRQPNVPKIVTVKVLYGFWGAIIGVQYIDFGVLFGIYDMAPCAYASANITRAQMSRSYRIFKSEVFYSK